jgi:hypothetical protein
VAKQEQKQAKSDVPDTFQLGAISAFLDFRACPFFNNLRVFNTYRYSNSPRLHHLFAFALGELQARGLIRNRNDFAFS